MTTIIEYLKQPSTWKGLVAIATALGVSMSQTLQTAVISAGIGLIGLIDVLVNEGKK